MIALMQSSATNRAPQNEDPRGERHGLRLVAGSGCGVKPVLDPWHMRLFNFLFALGFLAATLPLFLLIALAVKLESPGCPVFFRQWRTGLAGKRFRLYKFRTMEPDADRRKAELAHASLVEWPDFKVAGDPRVTRVGRVLRRLALDELPNFLNVLRGEMNVVGPRPTSFPADTYRPWQRERLAVLPGVTGVWQVSRHRKEGFDARVRQDLHYLRRRGLAQDLRVIIATIPAILRRRAAY